MTRALVRGLVALSIVLGFWWMVDNAAWILIAFLCLILAGMCIRSWHRNLPPLYVPAGRAAFPDPPHDSWGDPSEPTPSESVGHLPMVNRLG